MPAQHRAAVAAVALAVASSVPLEILTQVPFWAGSLDSWGYLVVFVTLSLVLVPLLGIGVTLVRHWEIVRFLRRERVDPAAVWRAATVRLPGSVAVVAGGWGVFAIGGGLVWVGRHEHFTVLTFLLAAGLLAMLSFGAGSLYLMVVELALLPVVRAVESQLPEDFADKAWLTIRRRLMLLTTGIAFTIGIEAAGLSRAFGPSERMWAVILVTLTLLLSYVGVLLALVSSSVTRRVADVQDAFGRVGKPGAPPRLRPRTGDDFDDLGRAFNAMVDLLDAHDRELRASRARLVAVSDEMRRRLEHDLHDGAQQHLALVNLQLGQLRQRLGHRPDLLAVVEYLTGRLAVILQELRRLGHGIYPAVLEQAGLVAALGVGAKQAEVRLMLSSGAAQRWAAEIEAAVYFCCWYLVRSARHHHGAGTEVNMALSEAAGTVVLTVVLRAGALGPPHDQAEAALYLSDRLGAVGGTVVLEKLSDALVVRGRVPVG